MTYRVGQFHQFPKTLICTVSVEKAVSKIKNSPVQTEKGWGSKVIDQLSRDLKSAFPEMKGFSSRNLKYMRQFAREYQNVEFVQEVLAQISWYHNITLLDKVSDYDEKIFYTQKTIENGWSRNYLVSQIEAKLHKREGKAITNFKDKLPSPFSDLAAQSLKDPYLFDFLSMGTEAHEKAVEIALIKHIEKFLLELGAGFSFMGRQYKLTVSHRTFYLDLLFYHTRLHCYVVIELKDKEFKAEHAGQLNFYLSTVDAILKTSEDNPTIGLILCKEKDNVIAEYALKDINKPIGLAEYKLERIVPENFLTSLPTIDDIEAELNRAMAEKQE